MYSISLDIIKDRLFSQFGDRYEYDFKNFKNTHSKILVKCQLHGWSEKMLKNLFKGHGCLECGNLSSSSKQKKNRDDIINGFDKVHGGKYDYSKYEYLGNRIKSIIICNFHGEFLQTSLTHLKGHGCPKCSGNRRLTKEEFIESSRKNHIIVYDYSMVNYSNSHIGVEIICPYHGSFLQTPMIHIRGAGCPKCNQSKGEKLIEQFLIENNIVYFSQKKFDYCKYINHLIFDFYLPDYNICVEFNGIQHYESVDIFGGRDNLDLIRKRDSIKSKYCKENSVGLIIVKQDKKHFNVDEIKNNIYRLLRMVL